MHGLTLTLLGGFRAQQADRAVTLSKKAQGLIAYLALTPGHSESRARLAGLLWGDRGEEQARNSLRQALFEIRRALGPSGERALIVEHEQVALDPAGLAVDALEVERLAGADTLEALEAAGARLGGDLLAGLAVKDPAFELWLDGQRERLRELSLRVLHALLVRQAGAGQTERAIETALRILALDALQEAAHRALMRLYASQGRGAIALRRYQACVDALWRELRVEPEPETKQLYREILLQRSTQSLPPARAAHPAAPSGEASVHPPLIGRDAELARVRAELARGAEGHARVVAILGEAGLGKTRLVEEVVAHAQRDGLRLVLGRAHESERILPFGLWAGALRGSHALSDTDTLKGLGAAWRQELARLFPEIGGRLGPARAGIDDHLRIFQAVGELLTALGRKGPLAIVLEDVHWADETSLRLTAFLARRLVGTAVTFLMTARVEELDPVPFTRSIFTELGRDPGLTEVRLLPLRRTETLELVRALAGRVAAAADPSLEERIWRASDGNPLVVVETLRALHERGLASADGTLPLPDGVRRILRERLDRLDGRARELVGIAAVIGREFELGVLREAAGLDTRELADAMEELVRRRLLHQVGEHFDFTHDRVRDVAYEEIGEPRRRMLHAAVAAAIEREHAQDLDAHRAALAGHHRRALAWDKAVEHLLATASQAAERGAYRDAVALFDSTREALSHLPPTSAVMARVVDLLLETRDLLITLGEIPRTAEHLAEAERLARQAGDERRLAHVLHRVAHNHWLLGDQARTIEISEQVRALGERLGDATQMGVALLKLGQAHNALGDHARAIEHFERGLRADPVTDTNPSRSLGVPSVITRTWLALSLAEVGRFDEAVDHGERGRREADAAGQLYTIFYAIYQLGRIHLGRGAPAHAVPLLERSASLAEAWHIGLMRGACADHLARAYVLAGRLPEARALLHPGALPPRSYVSARKVSRGECFLALDRVDDARTEAQQAVELARRFGERSHEAKALCLLAAVRAHQGQAGEAAALYREARSHAEALGLRPLVAQCQLGLGRLAEATGDAEAARTELTRAATTFRELGMPYWLAQVETALPR
jgi:DNA-binding SARP family transcriptional activator